MTNTKTDVLSFGICHLVLFWILCFGICHLSFGQEAKEQTSPAAQQEITPAPQEVPPEPIVIPQPDIEFNLDFNSKTSPLPKIFSPSIDLSGRGYHKDKTWPYHIAAKPVVEKWQKEVRFSKGIFRLHWNLWEANPSKKIDKSIRNQTIANYETIIKNISDAGGIVILNLYGTPPGFGRALDKRSPPANFKQWKLLVKNTVRYLSCEKKYNIWYEVWDTPDIDNFFLGEKRDYFNLYRFAAEAIKELERKYKINILIGGPSVTWWFQNFDGNNILSPEKSLIYELIKFCAQQKLPLDFISWHAYGTAPYIEKENTAYNKTASQLIRDWLSFFRFHKNIPLIVDEWNYDAGTDLSEERGDKSYLCASYIPARLKNMSESGIDYQVFFSLEDFQSEREEINNNRGIFSYDPKSPDYKIQTKSIYNTFLMLNQLGDSLYSSANINKTASINDEFLNILTTKRQEDIIILIWNYIDPYIERGFLSRDIALLSEKCRNALLSIIKEDKLNRLLNQELPIDGLSAPDKLKELLKKISELKRQSLDLINRPLNIKITLSNIKGDYLYQRYVVDNSCVWDCPFLPVEEKELTNVDTTYQKLLTVNPYSVHLIVLKKKVN